MVAKTLAEALQQFIRAYVRLALLSYKMRDQKFGLVPKVHAMHEVYYEMYRQYSTSSWVLSPLCETCSVDEDLVGRVASLTRCVSPQLIARRALARYLAQIQQVWKR